MVGGINSGTGMAQSRQISDLWMNSNPAFAMRGRENTEDEEVAAEDEDDMGVIETYSNYMPKKLKVCFFVCAVVL